MDTIKITFKAQTLREKLEITCFY